MRLIDADKRIEELKGLKVPQGSIWEEMRDFAVLSLENADTAEIGDLAFALGCEISDMWDEHRKEEERCQHQS